MCDFARQIEAAYSEVPTEEIKRIVPILGICNLATRPNKKKCLGISKYVLKMCAFFFYFFQKEFLDFEMFERNIILGIMFHFIFAEFNNLLA
jgi:hypothetical protein